MSQSQADQQPTESLTRCYLEFRVYDKQRFEIFKRFFAALQARTQRGNNSTTDETLATRVPVSPIAKTQEVSAVTASRGDSVQTSDFARPEQWLLVLRPQDVAYLGLPPHIEAINALKEWGDLSRRERRKRIKGHKTLQTLADFADMLKYWAEVEYELVSCEMVEADRGRIDFVSDHYPFEGKPALEELLLFFGFFSIVSDSC